MLQVLIYPTSGVSEYLIPARGLKHKSGNIEIIFYCVSEYLIPARGLKQKARAKTSDYANVSEYLIPARGLKHTQNPYCMRLTSFRISNPRKGTETRNIYFFDKHLQVSEYLIPARGLKHNLSTGLYNQIGVSEYLIPARGLKPYFNLYD